MQAKQQLQLNEHEAMREAYRRNQIELAEQHARVWNQPDAWRYLCRPMKGTIFDLPDNKNLVRGITYTILPDGKHMRVPARHRRMIRAPNTTHARQENLDIMQAMSDMVKNIKPKHDRGQRAPMGGMGRGGLIPVPGVVGP